MWTARQEMIKFGSIMYRHLLNLKRAYKNLPCNFQVSNEVSECLQQKKPVVGLESAIITHGMPYSENLRTALELEKIIRRNNVTPATVGVIDGKIKIGMTKEDMELLACKDKSFTKISRRDLPFVLSQKLTGGTTVAATMALSYMAGIEIIVTGGIGGVHRHGELSMDVSADLIEFSQSPVTVISSGVKSILDIGRTLEYLETYGVCVAVFGETKEFPAFFTPDSGFFVPHNIETVSEAAQLIISRDQLKLHSGILIAVPIPSSEAADGSATDVAISQALEDARQQNISGKDVTPFVLSRVKQLSEGASLRANIALIKNNAHIGSLIAAELAKLKSQHSSSPSSSSDSSDSSTNKDNKNSITCKSFPNLYVSSSTASNERDNKVGGRPVVIGGSNLDITITSLSPKIQLDGSTHVGRVENTAGGVGRNLADCLTRLNMNPLFLSAVGPGQNGVTLLSKMKHMDTSGIRILPDARTAVCSLILEHNGNCLFLIGDMDVHQQITVSQIQEYEEVLLEAPLIAIDGNISLETIGYILDFCSAGQIPVWFEPTAVNKASKPFACSKWRESIVYASPNRHELRVMHQAFTGSSRNVADGNENGSPEAIIEECLELSLPLVQAIPTLIVTLDSLGTLLVTKQPKNQPFHVAGKYLVPSDAPVRATHYYPPVASKIASVAGAGDCFAAAMIGAILHELDQESCIRVGQKAALLSTTSKDPVPDFINDSIFSANYNSADFPKSREIL